MNLSYEKCWIYHAKQEILAPKALELGIAVLRSCDVFFSIAKAFLTDVWYASSKEGIPTRSVVWAQGSIPDWFAVGRDGGFLLTLLAQCDMRNCNCWIRFGLDFPNDVVFLAKSEQEVQMLTGRSRYQRTQDKGHNELYAFRARVISLERALQEDLVGDGFSCFRRLQVLLALRRENIASPCRLKSCRALCTWPTEHRVSGKLGHVADVLLLLTWLSTSVERLT